MYISDAQYAELIGKITALEKRVNYLEKEKYTTPLRHATSEAARPRELA